MPEALPPHSQTRNWPSTVADHLGLPTRFWQNMSWRAKSMTFVLLLVALIYLSISIFLYTSVRNDLTNQVQTELLRLTETLASSAADPLLLKDGGKLGKLVELHNPLVQSIIITNRQHVVVASPDIRQLGQSLSPPIARSDAHQIDRFDAPILAGSNQLGFVYLQGNRQHISSLVNRRLDRTTSRLIVLGLITALLGLLGAYLVSLAMTRPVLRLLDEIESMENRLGLDKKTAMIRPPQSGDELHRLEWAFRLTEQRLQEHLTELRQLHQRQQAMQCMATIGEMSAQVAHEIRNALSSLRGAARYLVRYGQADHQGDFIRIIEEEVQRLYDMTQGFLDFGRPYAAVPVDTPIRPLLERCLARHRADLETKTIVATLDCPEMLHAKLDPSLLEQALSNLILNAIDALPMQGGVLQLSAEQKNLTQLNITVADNGPGIPLEKRATIFKPYVTTKTKGSGLGLAVVTKIMMVHDGSIELCDTAAGARFILHLPCGLPPPGKNASH
ncbi:ATP-binding protein [Acidithiobacillus montserratensis]|uniref:ATP-binding protein n=1 Tax=Acidithiobacillus montserratensis TaxID=2729135 RepID=A0ACD5HHA0_9PROT|nr:ATP-binding protein [Acidithiobacillus montserratensis]MBN2678665.1 two-component sensor histidine kinase [Acidithiobacillaceae bacterium]MBU2748185.1 two-component sensor histidine kinase [Acidithiobacillus montserratensis]